MDRSCSNDNYREFPIEDHDVAVEDDFNDENLDNDDQEGGEDIDDDNNYRLLRRVINRVDSRNEDPSDERESNCSSSSSTLTNSPQLVAGCSINYEREDSNARIRRMLGDKVQSNVGFRKNVCSNLAANCNTLDLPLSASALCDEHCKRSVLIGECTQLDDGLNKTAVCTEHESPSTSAVINNEESENYNNQKDNLTESGLHSFDDDDTDDNYYGHVMCSCLSPRTDFSDEEDYNRFEEEDDDADGHNNYKDINTKIATKKRQLDNGNEQKATKRLCVAGPSRAVECGLIDISCEAGQSQTVHLDISCVAGPSRVIEEGELDICAAGPSQTMQEGDKELTSIVASTFGIQVDQEKPPLDISSVIMRTSSLQNGIRNSASVDLSFVAGPSKADNVVMVDNVEPPFEISIYVGGSSESDGISILNSRLVNRPAAIPNWLRSFLSWPMNDKGEALRKLLNYCASAQLCQIMLTIKPIFQRDIVSLLPKEIALMLMKYLRPKDLMKASQTCRKWRTISNDNLIWKEHCRRVGIYELTKLPKYLISGSPWKSTYMKTYLIGKNWAKKSVKSPVEMRGHENHVITCLEFRGNFVLTGSDDCTLKVWSACDGRLLHDMVGHTGGVWTAQMVGDIVVSGSTDRTLRIWNMKSGKCWYILTGHSSTVRCLQMHEDKVVSGSRDATLRIWSLKNGRCLKVLQGHSSAVRCVQYDGKYVVSGGYDFYVKVWDPLSGKCIHTLAGHTNRIYSLLFDGVHVVSGSLDTSIKVWDVKTGALKHTLVGHQSLTSGMELKDNILISGNADTTIKVWDIDNGRCIRTLGGPFQHISAVTCLQTINRFIISSSDDGTVKLWDIHTGEFIRNLVTLKTGGVGGVVWRIRATGTGLVCAVGSRNLIEDTKVLSLNFNIPGTCTFCNE